MANLAVAYAGPDIALATLAAKLRRVYGHPTRTYEFVTGYDRNGITSHNADANGRAHAMDIFVGPGNLSESQGIDLAERLRAEGKRGKIPGHPDRLAYIIHRGQIAGDHTDWEWIAYTGKDWHGDHIHVSSVFDYYWGDPIPGNPADYNSNSDWDLWEAEFQPGRTLTGLGSGLTPIQEDEMSQAQVEAITASVNFAFNRLLTELPDLIAKAVLTKQVPHKDPATGKDDGQTTSLATMAGFADFQATATRDTVAAAARALVDAVVAAPGPDSAAAAEAAYQAFLAKLDGVTIKVGTK